MEPLFNVYIYAPLRRNNVPGQVKVIEKDRWKRSLENPVDRINPIRPSLVAPYRTPTLKDRGCKTRHHSGNRARQLEADLRLISGLPALIGGRIELEIVTDGPQADLRLAALIGDRMELKIVIDELFARSQDRVPEELIGYKISPSLSGSLTLASLWPRDRLERGLKSFLKKPSGFTLNLKGCSVAKNLIATLCSGASENSSLLCKARGEKGRDPLLTKVNRVIINPPCSLKFHRLLSVLSPVVALRGFSSGRSAARLEKVKIST
ncbi:hypothetical protein PoB_006608100 [Plakobranchus ocellatus]|uniref:Uncharacterized protein n=1 Tax=Plakobranchus ocellatus TaxID=259542 RepID=A0AAV4D695_9GAST|nr:hypothetical protein PoB_006608100 [Plakobranchus ocellatus]